MLNDQERKTWLKLEVLAIHDPPAAQCPADGHDTEVTAAYASDSRPRTSIAFPQAPFRSLTTNAWLMAGVSKSVSSEAHANP
jgi:hypothetical protein